jgi:streptogramin lyase
MKLSTKFLIIFIITILVSSPISVFAGTIAFKEAVIKGSDFLSVIEYYPDGKVYLVDDEYDLLWRIEPISGNFEKFYPIGIMNVMPDNGDIWLTDGTDSFGYFDTLLNPITLNMWKLPDGGSGNRPELGPIVVHNSEIWMATWFSSLFGIYHFLPDTRQLCHYSINGGSFAADMVNHGDQLSILDWQNDRLIVFDMSNESVIFYDLTSYPINKNAHLLVDNNYLWWTDDQDNGSIYQLNPTTHQIFIYPLPTGTHPIDLSELDGRIWFTEKNGSIGQMDPQKMSNNIISLIPSSPTPLSPSCSLLDNPIPYDGTPDTGTLSWSENSGEMSQPQTGLEFIGLIEGSVPNGITTLGDRIWVTDDGFNRIIDIKMMEEFSVFLPLLVR